MERFRCGALAALALVPVLSFGTALAEDPAPAPDPAQQLKAALETWGALPGTALKGKVEHLNDEAAAMMDMVKGMMGGSGGTGKPFRGEFEAWSTADVRAVLSMQDLPSVGFLDDGKSKLNRVTYSGKDAPDISAFRREALKILNRTTLVKALGGLPWTLKTPATDATGPTFEAKASSSMVPPDDSGAAPKGVLVEVDLALDGTFRVLRVTVVRADPLDALRQMAQMSGQAGMAGMLPPALTEDKLPRTVYTLEQAGDQPSERVKKLVDELKALGAK